MTGMTISEAVLGRRSIRAFSDRPVDLATLRRVMDKARWSPSGCNFQPWEATILTGAPLRALQEKMLAAAPQEPEEYAVTPAGLTSPYAERLHQLGARLYGAQDIARDDRAMRDAFMARNVTSFDAPALLLCHFPRFMGPPQWSDVGMWLQSVMLLLREEGLESCPQEFMALYARLIKAHIGVDDATHIFFCGIAIGYADLDATVNRFPRDRVPLDDQVRFVGF